MPSSLVSLLWRPDVHWTVIIGCNLPGEVLTRDAATDYARKLDLAQRLRTGAVHVAIVAGRSRRMTFSVKVGPVLVSEWAETRQSGHKVIWR
jgi:hypothetical protein